MSTAGNPVCTLDSATALRLISLDAITTEITWTARWTRRDERDGRVIQTGQAVGTTNDTTEVSMLAPAEGYEVVDVDHITLSSSDGAAHTLRIYLDNGTEYDVWKGAVPAGETVFLAAGSMAEWPIPSSDVITNNASGGAGAVQLSDGASGFTNDAGLTYTSNTLTAGSTVKIASGSITTTDGSGAGAGTNLAVTPGTGGSTSGAGGALTVQGGAGGAPNGNGGQLGAYGGTADGSGTGGTAAFAGGNADTTGNGGACTIAGGEGGSTSGNGGACTIAGGEGGSTSGNGGSVTISSGGVTSGTEGSITIAAGAGDLSLTCTGNWTLGLLTTKGDIIARGASYAIRLAAGTDGQALCANSTVSAGVGYAWRGRAADVDPNDGTDVTATTTETVTATLSLPAGEINGVGRVIEIRAWGRMSSAASQTAYLRLRVDDGSGPINITDQMSLSASSVSGLAWYATFTIAVRASGATGTISGHGIAGTNGRVFAQGASNNPVTLDLTAGLDFEITCDWGASSASNHMYTEGAVLIEY